MRILGFIIVVLLFAAGIHNGGTFQAFFDLSAVLLVLGTTVGGFLMTAGSQTGEALRAVFSKGASSDRLRIGRHGFRGGRIGALAGGGVSFGIGIIFVLGSLDDPGAIGPGLAISLLGFLWGAFLSYLVLLPIESGMERRLIEMGEETDVKSLISLDLLVLGLGLVICMGFFAVLMFSFGK